jgi:hypothetical protein
MKNHHVSFIYKKGLQIFFASAKKHKAWGEKGGGIFFKFLFSFVPKMFPIRP